MPIPTSVKAIAPPKPLGGNIVAEFGLDPSIAFLNHGSFGARPRSVMEAQSRRRAEFEAHPIQWLDRRRNDMIARARENVGAFLGMKPDNFGLVTNATGGINAVLRSLAFGAGEELVTTNHVYNAVRQTMKHLAERAGGKYVEVAVPYPVSSPDEILEAIESALTPRTRLLVIDHITSPTAVIFPVESIIQFCTARGIDVIVDGAHAPGMVPLNVEQLGAAYYAGNLHKWTCAPVGAAFIWVRPDKQQGIHPTTISHFLDESFVNEFNWQGTRDITSWLCVEDALAYFDQLGWPRVMKHNHELAVWVQNMLCEKWQVDPGTPLDGSMIGSMTTVILPAQEKLRTRFSDFLALRDTLYDRFAIEVPVVEFPTDGGRWWLRPCCQIYNRADQYERLAEAVLELIG